MSYVVYRDSNFDRGREFEKQIHAPLLVMAERFPNRVEVIDHPKILLDSGEEVIPDYQLMVDVGADRRTYFIECQDRERYDKDLLHKLVYVRSKQRVQTLLFVYGNPIPENLARDLERQGIVALSQDQFNDYVEQLTETLELTEALKRRQIEAGYEPVDLAQLASEFESTTQDSLREIQTQIVRWKADMPPRLRNLIRRHIQPLFSSQRYGEVVLLCNFALKQYPKDPNVAIIYLFKGWVRYIQGKDSVAEPLLLHAAGLAPNNPYPHWLYGRMCYARGDLESGIEAGHRARKADPEFEDVHLFLLEIYLKTRQFDHAIDAANDYLNCHEGDIDPDFYINRAWAFVETGRIDKARMDIDAIPHKPPFSKYRHNLLCQIALRDEDYSEALVQAERVLLEDREFSVAWYNKSCALSRLNRIDEALDCLEKAVSLDSSWVQSISDDPDFDPIRTRGSRDAIDRFQLLLASSRPQASPPDKGQEH